MAKVLLVDDEPGVLFALKEMLLDRGDEPVTASSGVEALAKLEGVSAAIVDYAMPGMDGLELIRKIHERDGGLPVMLITAHGSERVAVAAMRAGAYDYIKKPFDLDEISLVVERALEARRLRTENRRLAAEQAIGRRIIAESKPMQRLLDAVARVADKDVTVLLTGETGTGKELIASLIHAESQRKKKPLVRFNCAALPAELAEAELFGHAKGAFTGAQASRDGFFTQANHGTLVLDEIGEIPLPLQAKLLRALQEGEIQPVGSGRIDRVDVRIVASTNRNLQQEVKAGRFREDLFYRLAVVELTVPPLRDRRPDIAALAEEMTRIYAQKFGVSDISLAPDLVQELALADWPGNVRQLENTIARLIALHGGPTIGCDALSLVPALAGGGRAVSSPEVFSNDPNEEPVSALEGGPTLKEQVEAFERALIGRALRSSSGNHSEAARRLGVNRVTLIDKVRRYKL
jgi:two-component system response regulator AtoC